MSITNHKGFTGKQWSFYHVLRRHRKAVELVRLHYKSFDWRLHRSFSRERRCQSTRRQLNSGVPNLTFVSLGYYRPPT